MVSQQCVLLVTASSDASFFRNAKFVHRDQMFSVLAVLPLVWHSFLGFSSWL